MARRRVYEIARDEGIPSREVLEQLKAAGITVTTASSAVDEDEARTALANGSGPAPGAAEVAGPKRRGTWFWIKTTALALVGREEDDGTGPGAPTAPRTGKADGQRDRTDDRREPTAAPTPRRRHLIAGLAAAGTAVVILVVVLLATSGGGGHHATKAAKPAAKLDIDQIASLIKQPDTSVVAAVRTSTIPIYPAFHASRAKLHLDNPNLDGAPLVFLVKAKRGRWLQVYLPSRPNGSVGWIKSSRVELSAHRYRALVDLRLRKLTVWNGPSVVVRTAIGVGHTVTPTPSGKYYVTELLKQPEPDGPYGPYAFGLSVHSNVLHEFAGRDGILGMHGTDEPDSIGTDVSHGCIRMSNEVVTRLARELPIGTPVRITRA